LENTPHSIGEISAYVFWRKKKMERRKSKKENVKEKGRKRKEDKKVR
jgi:hypothetical protein